MAVLFAALLCVLAAAQVQGQAQRVAVARFSARGVSGYIRFTEVEEGIQIEANLQGLRGSHAWHVHELPVDQTLDPLVQCLSDNVGPHYDPFNRNFDDMYTERCAANPLDCEAGDLAGKFGMLMPDMTVNVVDNTSTLFLRDLYSIIGRSVVIHQPGDSANFECGTIRSITEMNEGVEVALLQSSFINPVAGTVYFRQVEGEDVQIWGKFYWTRDQPTTMAHNWHIHENAPGEEYRQGRVGCTPAIIGGHFIPFDNGPPGTPEYAEVCAPNRTAGCEVGDLTGKHAPVNVAAQPFPYRMNSFFFTDNFLNLTGVNAVVNRSVAIHNPNGGADIPEGDPVIACAPLVPSENIVLYQYRLREVTMSQNSPFEDTVITTEGGARATTTIEDFPFNLLVQTCSGSDGTLFAPYDAVPVDPPGVETPDRFVIGDLQSRYGEISGATVQRAFDVPIYGGEVSISSLTLRSGATCNALIPMLMGENVIVAKASFSRVARGAVYLVQEDFGFDQLGNTHIIVDVYYNDPSTTPTTNHNWHVHQLPAPEGDCVVDGNALVGPHYNPFNVSLRTATSDPVAVNSDYSTDCSPRYQLRCEQGDLTGKHGQLDISPDGDDRPTYTYVDSNLQLAGDTTIIGRSIALHDIITGLPIFDCGTVERVYLSTQRIVVRTSSSEMSRNALTGTLAAQVDDLEPTDILVLSQERVEVLGLTCVDVYMHVLGSSASDADSTVDTLNAMVDDLFACGAPRLASVSMAAVVLPLLMAAFYLLGLAEH